MKCVLFCCGPSLAKHPYPAAENTVLYDWAAKQHTEGTAETDTAAARLKEATAMLRWHYNTGRVIGLASDAHADAAACGAFHCLAFGLC
jgi:hypothetical protein